MSRGIIALQMTNFEKLYKSLDRGQFHKSINAGIFWKDFSVVFYLLDKF